MNRVNLSNISLRFRHVWFRNLITYRRIWKVNFMVPLLEPGFYILAFGLGFSGLIGRVSYAGMQLEYVITSYSIHYTKLYESQCENRHSESSSEADSRFPE